MSLLSIMWATSWRIRMGGGTKCANRDAVVALINGTDGLVTSP